jgi:hypothetical protein
MRVTLSEEVKPFKRALSLLGHGGRLRRKAKRNGELRGWSNLNVPAVGNIDDLINVPQINCSTKTSERRLREARSSKFQEE